MFGGGWQVNAWLPHRHTWGLWKEVWLAVFGASPVGNFFSLLLSGLCMIFCSPYNVSRHAFIFLFLFALFGILWDSQSVDWYLLAGLENSQTLSLPILSLSCSLYPLLRVHCVLNLLTLSVMSLWFYILNHFCHLFTPQLCLMSYYTHPISLCFIYYIFHFGNSISSFSNQIHHF